MTKDAAAQTFGFEQPVLYNNTIERISYNFSYKNLSKSFSDIWAFSLSNFDASFSSKLLKTDWLGHIENVLLSAQKAASIVRNGEGNVLIYCPQGNISTPLLTSLAQIFCDPYYRSLNGFKTLILKEWVFFQHNFIEKSLILDNPDDKKKDKPTVPKT